MSVELVSVTLNGMVGGGGRDNGGATGADSGAVSAGSTIAGVGAGGVTGLF